MRERRKVDRTCLYGWERHSSTVCFNRILGINDDDDLASELEQFGLRQHIRNLDASKQATCFHYLLAMPHRPLNPSMMLSTEPVMKAPCVTLIACRNLWKAKGGKKSSFVINVSKARRHRERETPQKYKLNGEFLKSEVPGVCATIRGG
jgi:hypothetical protein